MLTADHAQPCAPMVSLTEDDRKQLEMVIRAGSTPQALAFRTQVVWRAADSDTSPNLQIGRNWVGTATPSPCGGAATYSRASQVCKRAPIRPNSPSSQYL